MFILYINVKTYFLFFANYFLHLDLLALDSISIFLDRDLLLGDIQGSVSRTGSPGSRSPGPGILGPGPGLALILKSGTQIQNLRDLGLGPGLKFEKSGTRDWDRDTSKNPGSGTGTGTRDSGTQLCGTVPGTKAFRDSVPGTENFLGHGPGPLPTPGDICSEK